MTTLLGVDVGGTATKVGLLRDGAFAPEPEVPTPPPSATVVPDVVDLVAATVDRLAARERIDAVGLVVPGYVDAAHGVGLRSENLGWRDAPFGRLIGARIDLPVSVGHDVRAGALAEARLGAAAGHRDVLFVPVGTGIAAGLVLDGVLHERPEPVGEIGHVDVGHDKPCACGRTGCLEAIASAAAIAARYAARTGGPAVTAAHVAELVAAGDPVAREVWDEAVEALAGALVWCCALVSPGAVVVGGGLARAGDLLLAPLRESLARRLPAAVVPDLLPASFGSAAGCVGAALLAGELLG